MFLYVSTHEVSESMSESSRLDSLIFFSHPRQWETSQHERSRIYLRTHTHLWKMHWEGLQTSPNLNFWSFRLAFRGSCYFHSNCLNIEEVWQWHTNEITNNKCFQHVWEDNFEGLSLRLQLFYSLAAHSCSCQTVRLKNTQNKSTNKHTALQKFDKYLRGYIEMCDLFFHLIAYSDLLKYCEITMRSLKKCWVVAHAQLGWNNHLWGNFWNPTVCSVQYLLSMGQIQPSSF